MGDMSDLPNLNHKWIRRVGGLKIFFGCVAVVLAAAIWAFAQDIRELGLSVNFDSRAKHVMIGAPYSIKTVLKNDAAQTMQVDLQAVLYSKQSTCVETGKHLNFSHPLKVKVAPNASMTVDLLFDPIVTACEMSVGMKAFLTAEMDGKRYPITQDANLSIDIL